MSMAVSRFLSQSLARSSLRPPAPLIAHPRHRSTKARRAAQIADADADAASSSQSDSPEAAAEAITVGIRKFEEAIQNIMVRRAAPDWLPFLPGYSYWVPPRATSFHSISPAGKMIMAVEEFDSPSDTSRDWMSQKELSEDEQMSLTSTKGWPSYEFYVEGTSPVHPLPAVEVKVEDQNSEDNEVGASNSADEEG
ncbi:uncharacterized protein LOC127264870 [Andrographis paniculata]|uniref:uncharacterized protein LOC127264870 n=1 Tax=Andrographis paniculata TaxID=175694 RepID=UPI0021E85C6C|nr:uncharacterized protein LOC127264870 [Andrographis paniculata]XP_051150387.1 uncharacterized protein LOC127264870 [Andrographis paniculata]